MNIFGVAILVCILQCAQAFFSGGSGDACAKNPCKNLIVTVKDENIKHGSNNRVFVMPGVTATLSEDCFLTLNLCFNVTKGFDSAKLNYEITKGIRLGGEKGKDVGEGLKELGIDYCPYPIKEPGVYCSKPEKPISLQKFCGMMSLACGEIIGTVDAFFDNEKKGDYFKVTVIVSKSK